MSRWKGYGVGAAVVLTAWALACGDDATGPQFAARMYIGDIGTHRVLMYRSPYTPSGVPTDSLAYGPYHFLGVAVDANGNLAASVEGAPSHIFFYDAPVRSGATPRDSINYLGYGTLLKFGPGGKLFVPTSSTNLLIYTPPFSHTSVPDTIKTGLANSFSIAFDAADRLYVGDNSEQDVHVYDSPYTGAPAFTVTNGLVGPVAGVAVDRDGRLFVADNGQDHIVVYEPPLSAASTAAFAITIGVENPIGITIGADGALYVANSGAGVPSITIYEPPFSAVSAPTITMSGGGRLATPWGIAVGAR